MEDVEPSEPMIAPAAARIRVGEDWCLLRECVNKNSDGTVVFLRLEDAGAPIVKAHRSDYDGRLDRALKHPDKFLSKSYWNRQFIFQENPYLVLRVFTRVAQWTREVRLDWGRWQFPFPITLDWLLRTPEAEIRREAKLLLQDPQSDCSFALRWASVDENEKADIALRTAKGSVGECRNVLKWTLIHHYTDDVENGDWMGIYTSRSDKSPFKNKLDMDDFCRFHDANWSQVELPEEVERCFALAYSYFRLSYKSELRSYTAINDILKERPYLQMIYFSAPSQHEILEATLQLRDFLRDKVSPDELAELMGE